ncbi:MAG: xanthine dehydrogenase subunit D [Streptosporangiales bacterium]|nr:xanthine dehydrogenase subunit D [Streptosporangiales bacterium]
MTPPAAELLATTPGGVGDDPVRPDGRLKVDGAFPYASDLTAPGMLWGATLRSPHPYARILRLDVRAASALPGVHAVLTHADVPGAKHHGQDDRDQPVLAIDVVRFHGEPVAIVAAEHPETARRALALIEIAYEVLEPVTDAVRAAFDRDCPRVHAEGNVVRHQPVRVGNPEVATADVVVAHTYHVGMQDQAFLGPEAGLAIPADDGGVDLHVATQWLHVDLAQVAPCLGLPEDKVRMTLAGVGGAFGGREDLSMQVHACLLALRTGRPVRMAYNREESFYGHVHRHPATLRYEHGADADGRLVYVKAEIVLDGGAYAATTRAVVGNAASLGVGPYEVPHVAIDAYGVYTNNPPCGAMRGFGAVQACFAYESQMDALAAAVGLDPVEIRVRNAVHEGSRLATGQVLDSPAPLAEILRELDAMPMPTARAESDADLRSLPGGVANTTHGEGVIRGVGYGVGIKNLCFSEGFDDYSTAHLRLEVVDGEPVVRVHSAAAEVGQGLVTVQAQIARTELGVSRVVLDPADTNVGSAGSSSASRQSYMTAGAMRAACARIRDEIAARLGIAPDDLVLLNGGAVSSALPAPVPLARVVGDGPIDVTEVYRHRATKPMDPVTGQGDTHVQLALCAHRAVVDVDTELGLVKVVELAAVEDVGRVVNRTAVEGQIHGGTAQGLGLAVLEEMVLDGGLVRNPSFTDYLIPTILDMPPMRLAILEHPDPNAPYGLRGVGEPATLSSTPAVVAAIRAATGRALRRVPVRPDHLVT